MFSRWILVIAVVLLPAAALAQLQVDGVGAEAQGADVAVTNLDEDPRPEIIFVAYDNPPQDNMFRYRIGWNIDLSGVATSWSSQLQAPGAGWEGQGAGVAFFDIDGNTRPDMFLMAYDNPAGPNNFRYRIGWNLNNKGQAMDWSGVISVPGVGNEASGASIAFTYLDANQQPELILMAYDNPPQANTFRYKIGWNVANNGQASRWSAPINIDGVGWEAQGAGVAIANLDANMRPDMVLMAYDNPAGTNAFRYKIGWNLTQAGAADNWEQWKEEVGLGAEAQGAGVEVALLGEQLQMILMAYDNPQGGNSFRYKLSPIEFRGVKFLPLDPAAVPTTTKITVRKLVCHDTEDITGDDSARLEMFIDGKKTDQWKKDMNEDDSHGPDKSEMVINKTYTFKNSVEFKLWDEDWPDADDLLGTVTVNKFAQPSGRAGFTQDDASYSLLYKVEGPSSGKETPQARADRLLKEFRNSTAKGVFTHAGVSDKKKVADSIEARLKNPVALDQGSQPLCGPSAIMYEVLQRRPDRYVEWVVALWKTGKVQIGGKWMTVSSGLKGSAVGSGLSVSDWIIVAGLRDAANILLDLETGEIAQGLAGLTTPLAEEDWTRKCLNAWGTNIESSILFGEFDDIKLAHQYYQNGGVAFLMIDADALDKKVGFVKNVPTHWVVYKGNLKIFPNKDIQFDIWTWGYIKSLKLSKQQFYDLLFGVVVGMPPD
jgi:hypothetical protein